MVRNPGVRRLKKVLFIFHVRLCEASIQDLPGTHIDTRLEADILTKMASTRQSSGSPQKFPLRRLEQTVQKFIIILQIDLERLQKHQVNIERVSTS
jgi:hypothetical protein